MGGLSSGPIIDPPRPPQPLKLRVEKSPIQISSNRLEVDENVNRSHFRTHWLAVKLVNGDGAQYMQSPIGLATIVVMTLFSLIKRPFQNCSKHTVY